MTARPLHTYVAIYRGRQHVVRAPDLWTAKRTAMAYFGLNTKHANLMAIVLARTASGEPVNTIPQIS